MTQRITIDPMTRIEGHLKIEVEVENGKVKGAVVALQWHLGMHGFEQSRKMAELEPTVILPSS